MVWALVMLLSLPLLRGSEMMRTWLALTGASAAAWLMPNMAVYIAIDLIAAAIVVRHPAGWAQRTICLLFIVMLFFEIGFVLSPGMNLNIVANVGVAAGWFQWALLIGWGLNERMGIFDSSRRTSGGQYAFERNQQ